MYLPELKSETWLNSPPLSRADLEGKVVLLDFWDYTCINCIRTLPYIRDWHAKYRDKGLVIIGVHTPEFPFARDKENVARAVKAFGLEYPIVLDSDYAIWNALGNRYWPAKYFFDHRLTLRSWHFGEGAYAENEAGIQALLRERDPSVELPKLETTSSLAEEGAFCVPTTPELYLGYARGVFGNRNAAINGQPAKFVLPQTLAQDIAYLDGEFIVREWSVSALSTSGRLLLDYEALEVNLVLHPPDSIVGKLEIRQDGEAALELAPEAESVGGRTILSVDVPRMYNLIHNPQGGRHTLELTWLTPGMEAFAFTFTGCG